MRYFSLSGINAQSSRLLQFNALFSIALFGVVDVLLNFYFVSLGYTDESIGLLQSLPRVGGLIAAVLIVPLTARMSARNVLIWTTIGMAISQAMIVFIPTTPAIALSRAALGLFFGMQQIAINPVIIALSAPGQQTRMFGYISMTSNVAGSIGGFIGGFVPAWIAFLLPSMTVYGNLPAEQTPFAYGLAIVLASATTALAVLPILRLDVPDAALPTESDVNTSAARIPWRQLLPRGLPMLFFGITGGLTFPFYNLFFRSGYGISDAAVGSVLSLGFFIMAFPVMLGPQIERRWGRGRGLLFCTALSGIAYWGLSYSTSLFAATACFVLAISLRNIVNGIYPPMLLDGLPPHMQNAVSSLGFLSWNVGWLFSTSIGGFLAASIGYSVILRIVGVGVMLIGLSAWWVYRRADVVIALRPAAGEVLPAKPAEL